VLVTDRTVLRLHGRAVLASLRAAGFRPRVVAVAPGERSKTLEGAGRVLAELARLGAGREAAVFALGGGVITDLGGFAAAIHARGVPWIAAPTTLLAMADAAVGGKTGVDLPGAKNAIGAFHLPRLVLADAALLRTLRPRHVSNGLAEVAKCELLRGLAIGLPRLRRLAAAGRFDSERLGRVAARAATAKARVVEADPLERNGRRAVLNLGHTVGHALEAATGFDGSVLHGEAVAIGLVAAVRVAEARGLAAPGRAEEVGEALRGLRLPTALPRGVARRRVLDLTRADKKRRTGGLRMVLPREAGAPVLVPVSARELSAALR
jgi:3-dehydroquinate synthetase